MLTTRPGSAPRGTEIRHAVVMILNPESIDTWAYKFEFRSSSVVFGTIESIYVPPITPWTKPTALPFNAGNNASIRNSIKGVLSAVPYSREVPLFLIQDLEGEYESFYQLVQSNITAPLNLQSSREQSRDSAAWLTAATFQHHATIICGFNWGFSRPALVLNATTTSGTLEMCRLYEDKDLQYFPSVTCHSWETWNAEDFDHLIAITKWRENKHCLLTLDGPHKTPVLVVVPQEIMTDNTAFDSFRATIQPIVSTWPGYRFAKYVAPALLDTGSKILKRFVLMPIRYAVVLVADSTKTEIVVYKWLYQANTRVLGEEVIKIGSQTHNGDIRELQLYNPGPDAVPELADTLCRHLHPLFEYTKNLLKEAGDRPIPFKMVIKQGQLDAVLTQSLVLCLREFKHVDTNNPQVVEDNTTLITEIARTMFEPPAQNNPQEEPKKYVAILEKLEDESLSITLYEGQVVNSVVVDVQLIKGPIPYAPTVNDWGQFMSGGIRLPLLVCSVTDLGVAAITATFRTVWSKYPRDKIEEYYETRTSHPDILLDMAYRFLTISPKHAIVLDAGSSGTRIFVYQWRGCIGSDKKQVLPDDINLPRGWNSKKSKADGGIDKLAPIITGGSKNLARITSVTAKNIADNLDPMFEYARGFLPAETKSIPVFLLATAGMRLLKRTNFEGYNFLWKELSKYLGRKNYTIEECKLISGEEEGLYGWVAANFISKTLKDPSSTNCFVETGGASAQIAFSVEPGGDDNEDYNGPLTKIALGGTDFHVFSRTWLGGGAQSVWKTHEEKMGESDTAIVHDPCLPIQYSYTLEKKTVLGTGDFDACMEEILSIIRPPGTAPDSPFLMENAPKPNPANKVLGASVFWYATHGVFGGSTDKEGTYGLRSFHHDITDLLTNTWDEIKIKHPTQNPNNLKLAFFNAALVAVTLQYGYGVRWDTPGSQRKVSYEVTNHGRTTIGLRADHTDTTATDSKTNFNSIDATWTLGRAIIHACGSTPELQTRHGWNPA